MAEGRRRSERRPGKRQHLESQLDEGLKATFPASDPVAISVGKDFPEQKEAKMPSGPYPTPTRELAQKRRELAPDTEAAFQAFSQKVFADGALPAKIKQLIAVAVAHVTQCPYCIKGHTKAALRHGALPQELMEAIWVAAEMRAGGAYAHSILAIEETNKPG